MNLGVAMRWEVLQDKREEGCVRHRAVATWNTRRLPTRLTPDWTNRLYVACRGVWRGSFPLSGDVYWTPGMWRRPTPSSSIRAAGSRPPNGPVRPSEAGGISRPHRGGRRRRPRLSMSPAKPEGLLQELLEGERDQALALLPLPAASISSPTGRDNAIAVNHDGVWVRPSTGSSFPAVSVSNWTGGPFYGQRGTFFADVTGDGRADAIAVNDDGVWVRPSTGSQFPAYAVTNWTGHAFYGERGTFFVDVHGDGAADAIAVNESGVWVRNSDGRQFALSSLKNWTGRAYYGLR